MFVLIVNDFGIEYVGDSHLHHLCTVLTDHYTITEDLNGKTFSDIYLNCNYAKDHTQLTCCLSMDGYVENMLLKFGHKTLTKPQLSPHRHQDIVYGSKQQLAAEEDTNPNLTKAGIKHVQYILGALLCYACALNNTLLVGLIAIGAQQASSTEQTAATIDQLLDHIAT